MKHYEKPLLEIIFFELTEEVLTKIPGATPGVSDNDFGEDDFE